MVVRIDATGDEGRVTLTGANGAGTAPKAWSAQRSFQLIGPSPGALLRTLHAALRSHGGNSDVRGIEVVPGPGTFSRVRLGVVTANALAWALRVPLTVRGRRVRIAQPVYGKPPHITLPVR